ncbi:MULTISPECIES: histidine kinase [unclassified Spirosoma]|uniref:sensor histidine kinase n=1 Tax=unclassified Spirosoma TaxID=2621999 RepID=UPI000964927F|nr:MULTISPECIES: histidine kinase [unclassified Spirosoma]MBN8824669.1 histidine kinase [Spirosoma sp.]OJW78781.1 MAG: hypothetical protein BGO59_09870 [Spirosoma sp. 48-14]
MRSVLLLLFVLRVAQAQPPNLKLEHLTIREGLPSNDVWCLHKDRQGFLWIGTGRNICRYDGYDFLRLDSLKLGYCSGISSDSKGNLYTSNDTKGLCKIDTKTLAMTTVVTNNYDDTDPTNDLHEQSLVDSHDQVWVCDYSSVKRYNPATGKLHRYTFSRTVSGGDVYQYASFLEDNQKRLWIVSEIGLYQYDRSHDRLICVLGPEATQLQNRIPIRLCRASVDAAGNLWLGGYEYGLVWFSPDKGTFRIWKTGFEYTNVTCAQESQNENGRKMLFVGTDDGISVFYPDRNALYNLPTFSNTGVQVKDMHDDRANGILWIGTREGIYKYRYRNAGIRTVAIPPDVVRLPVQITSILPVPGGSYLLGLSRSGALHWNPATNRFRRVPYPMQTYTQQLRWIMGRPFAFTEKGVFVGDPSMRHFSAWEPATRLFKSLDFRDGLLDRKGRLWILNLNEGPRVIDPKTGSEIKLWSDKETRQLTHFTYMKGITEGIDGRIWIATCTRALFHFDEKRAKFINIEQIAGDKTKILGGDCVNGMQQTPDGSILIASWGGVSKVSSTGKILTSFEFQTDALMDTYCANIAEAPDHKLWFSTNEGVHIANPQNRSIRYLTTIEGLYSNAPVGFYYNRPANELLLGHTNVLNRLNMVQIDRQMTVPHIVISSVEVKGKPLHQDLSKEISLQPDENAITLNFSALNYEPDSKNQYRYKLDGVDTAWVDLGDRHTLSFTNLPPATYQLALKSGNAAGIWSAKPLMVRFTVNPHFSETWWFRSLLGLLLSGIVVGLMRWRVDTLGERNKLDLEITELKLKALQSQMNPHFLFNSLNSVQHYLLTNQGIEGARYLSKFSKLVRRIMENSNHQYLRFEQIIETLKMYVEIESFRFNHEFQYEFCIDQDDETLMDALLPPMLLQPYVENAIWHGLMPKEGFKKLTISARTENDHIVCQIEDNGVGRQFAPRTEGHISRGQEMTRGIFDSLRRKDSDARLEVIDLVDTEGQPIGTRINMLIPLENS